MATRAAANCFVFFVCFFGKKKTENFDLKKKEKKRSTRHLFRHTAAGQETSFFSGWPNIHTLVA